MLIEGKITAERESWLSFLEGMFTKRESDLVIIEIRKFTTFRKSLRDLFETDLYFYKTFEP